MARFVSINSTPGAISGPITDSSTKCFAPADCGCIDYIAPPLSLKIERLVVANRQRATVIDCFNARKGRKDTFVIVQIGGYDLGATICQLDERLGIPSNSTQIVTIFQG